MSLFNITFLRLSSKVRNFYFRLKSLADSLFPSSHKVAGGKDGGGDDDEDAGGESGKKNADRRIPS